MSKARREDPEIADEYDFSNAVRGKYAEQMKDGYTVQIVSDEEDRLRRARLADEADAERGQASGTRGA
jgi:hypothetical protein